MAIQKDIVIFGGGIAGLWLLNRLRSTGFQAILLESQALGQGQSIASQGMIHGGMKYALGGKLTGASEAIADMPEHWRACLQGKGDVDLRNTRLLSDTYYMWPRNTLRSRFNAFLGSKAVRGKVDDLSDADWPEFFRGNIRGPLYALKDIVLDVPTLLQNLADNCRDWIYQIDWSDCALVPAENGGINALILADGTRIEAKRFISTSGEGTEQLLSLLNATPATDPVAMQRRPLQMVVVKHNIAEPLYVHCVAEQLSDTPELTITTHPCKDGRFAWYLGGELAETGASINQEEQQQEAKAKLADLFPWLDMADFELSSFYINRAEAQQKGGKRPDQWSIRTRGNLLCCWPTKLTLAPALANAVLQQLTQAQVHPGTQVEMALTAMAFPPLATTPWDADYP